MTNFYSTEFLQDHIKSLISFYLPNMKHPLGGFHHNFLDDGTVFNPGQRHLVSSCRMVYNLCKSHELFGDEKYLKLAEDGLLFLETVHYDPKRNAYNWVLEGTQPVDQTNHCYGLAFVILTHATALQAGFEHSREPLYRAYDILEKHFWQPEAKLYADEISADWQTVSDYRGQNANMHSCEAMIAAYQATQDEKFLNRALELAETVTETLTQTTDGLIWEHYTKDLQIDWDFNKDDPKNLYRPWGYQPGHQTEWTKLLLLLNEIQPNQALVAKAADLFDRALAICWDKQNGGILYGFAPDNTICDDDKYFWVQAETFAAAAHLYKVTGEDKYLTWYNKIWDYSNTHMIDHKHGGWYRLLTGDNRKYSDEKSTAGGKCDYHTIGACYHVLRYGI